MGFYIGIPYKQSYKNESGQTITISWPNGWADFGPQILQSNDGNSFEYIRSNYWDYHIFTIYNGQVGDEEDYVVYYINESTLVNIFNQQVSPFAHNYSSTVSGETSLPTGTRLWRYSEEIGYYQSAWPSGFGDSEDAGHYNVEVYLFDQEVIVQPTTITFNANGGNIGTSSISVRYGSTPQSITPPTRSGYSFLGYYDTSSIYDGTQYFNSTGTATRTWDKVGTEATLWARWQVIVSYDFSSQSFTTYCYDGPAAYSSTPVSKEITISTNGYSCPQPITVVEDTEGWEIAYTGRRVVIPEDTPAGDYDININISVSDGLNYVGYNSDVPIHIQLLATSVSSYGEITDYTGGGGSHFAQTNLFPAGEFIISRSTIGNYFENLSVCRQVVYYNNGTSRAGTVTYGWEDYGDQTISSLGTTVTSQSVVNNFLSLTLMAYGEGNKSRMLGYVSSGNREANVRGTTKYKNTSGTEGYNTTYGEPTINVVTVDSNYNPTLTAAGGNGCVVCSCINLLQWYWRYTSGAYESDSSTEDGIARWTITSQTFTPNGSSTPTTISRFTPPQTGYSLSGVGTVYDDSTNFTHENMTTNVGTDEITVTAYNIGDISKTDTASAEVINTLGTQRYRDTNGTQGYLTDGGAVSVSMGNNLDANVSEETVNCFSSNTLKWYQRYDSGSYTGLLTETTTGTAYWKITTNGNNRFSHSGTAHQLSNIGTVYESGDSVIHDSMGTEATTDTLTVTAYNPLNTNITEQYTVTITNAVESLYFVVDENPISFGSATNGTVAATFTSGDITNVTGTYAQNPTGIVSVSGDTVSGLWVDDFPIYMMLNNGGVTGFLNDYGPSSNGDRYYVPDGTITYNGSTCYLWRLDYANDGVSKVPSKYIVTSTNDAVTLINSSLQYNYNNINTECILAELKSDKNAYAASSYRRIVRVDI
jgi:hypothetical protein